VMICGISVCQHQRSLEVQAKATSSMQFPNTEHCQLWKGYLPRMTMHK